MIFELHRSRQLGYTGREERAAYEVKFRILRAHRTYQNIQIY